MVGAFRDNSFKPCDIDDVLANRNKSTEKPMIAAESTIPAVEVVPVTIHPAASLKPALKYHLLPMFWNPRPAMLCHSMRKR